MNNLTIKALALNLLILSCGSMVAAEEVKNMTQEQRDMVEETNNAFKRVHASTLLVNDLLKRQENNKPISREVICAGQACASDLTDLANTLNSTCQAFGYKSMNPAFFSKTLNYFLEQRYFDKFNHCTGTSEQTISAE